MLPNISRVSSGYQPAGNLTNEEFIDSQIRTGYYELVIDLLDTEIMTENQLNIIKSRFENRLTNQYVNYINQMIDLARECGLAPQETVVSPFNVAGIEGSDRTVSATPAHDVRAMANQPQASNQALSGANRCNNDDSNSVNQRSGQGALMKVNPQWNVESIWSLNLVAQYCNKTDIEIDAEIDKADRETTLRIIDFQPMTHDQLNRILHDARVKLGRRKMNEISTRLEYCPPGKREINTPYWRRLYMNESPKVFEDTISSNVIHVGRQIEYQRMLVPMTVIVTGAKYRDFISCNPSGANEETAQYIIDISETIIMRSVTDRQTVSVEDTDRQTVSVEDTARQTVSVEDTARQTDSVDDTARQTDSVDDTARQTDSVDDIARQTDSGNVEWTRTGYVLIHLLVNLTVENYNELRFLSREGILNRNMLRNSLVLRERQQELDRQKARETVNRQNTIASLYRRTVQNEYEQVRMQLAFRDSTTGSEYEAASASASASAATARRGVRSDWDSETQKQMLAEGGGDQEKLQTIEEIEAETEAFKKEKQCAYESCTNDYSVLYLHGSDAIAHIIHCQEHALSIDDRCPRCDQAIKGVVPIYLT